MQLVNLLRSVGLIRDRKDGWVWCLDSTEGFSTKSSYNYFLRKAYDNMQGSVLNTEVYKALWKCKVPNKILAFSCQAFKGRIPTKDSLLKRGVLMGSTNLNCVFCNCYVEDPQHLFIPITVAQCIWSKVYGWLGVAVVQPLNLEEHFLQHTRLFGGKNKKRRGSLI